MSNILDAALNYASLGYPVFPCQPNGKAPMTAHGCLDATTDPDQIRKWWSRWPEANVAIATVGLLVLDIDFADNPWPGDERAGDLLQSGACAITPRGGRHYWFRQQEGKAWRNTTGRLARDVDTRADGGYVLVWPSVTEDGAYAWVDGLELGDVLNEPPEWLTVELDRLAVEKEKKPARPANTSEPSTHSIPDAGGNWWSAIEQDYQERTEWDEILPPHGWAYAGPSSDGLEAWTRPGKSKGTSATTGVRSTGNDLLHVFSSNAEPFEAGQSYGKFRAFSLLNHGGSLVQAAEALRAEGYGQSGESEKVDLTAFMAWASGEEDAGPSSPSPVDPGPFPEHLLQVPGFIGDVMEYMLATAKRRQPVLSLAPAISLMATLIGRKVVDRAGTRPNLYVLGLAPSGSGKDEPRQVCKRVLAETGQSALIGPEGVASVQALARSVYDSPSCLALLDEFGKTLALIAAAGKSPFIAAIPSLLLKLYSSSAGVWRADSRADRENDFEINQPCLTVYGTSVAEPVFNAMTTDTITEGLLGRFLVFEGDELPDKERPSEQPLPCSIVRVATAWGGYGDGGNLSDINPTPAVVQATDEAESLLSQFDKYCDDEARRLGYPFGALWARAAEKASKLTLIYACSIADEPEAAFIDADAVRWGCSVSAHVTQRMAFLAHNWISDGKYDKDRKRILRIIRTAGHRGIKHNDLVRKVQDLPSKDREIIIDALVEADEIRCVKRKTRGRSATVYEATQAVQP